MTTAEQARPTEISPTSDLPESDTEALFREAKRRERRRRLTWLAAVVALAAAGIGTFAVTRAGSTSGPGSPSAGSTAAGGHVAGVGKPLALPADATIVLLIDTSGSMQANDVKPTRFEVAMSALQTFVGMLPQSTQVGLVTFSTTPEVLVKPTVDRPLLLNALGMITPNGGTALGDGLDTAVRLATSSLDGQGTLRAPGQLRPAAVILESDGQQNRGALTPAQAATLAKEAGIRVDGISLGSPTGKISYPFGQGTVAIAVPPDPKTVRRISNVTGGESFNAEDAADLNAIYAHIASDIG